MATQYVYVNNDVQLTLTTDPDSEGHDFSTATTRKIYYKKPSGTVGNWTATLVGSSQLRYAITDTQLNETGIWTFYAYIVTGGLIYQGKPAVLEVRNTWKRK